MTHRAFLAIVLALTVGATAAPVAAPAADLPEGWGPVSAAEVRLADLLWQRRAVVVFADSPFDPAFARQMRLLEADPEALIERDVLVITDTDPAARGDVRTTLRPRGFALVIVGKDGQAKLRKPLPWDVREITHAIDKFPLRRQEMLEQLPAGR